MHHVAIKVWFPVPERGDHVPNGLINVPDHLVIATEISIVTHAVYVAPNTMNATFESKFKKASISFLRK